ncbi:MAG TPA: hypothetical protein VNH18_07275 [Bryobacteraceae bacterium]|nr:hypothetical protein [Bryobacteraceae bacterium]HXJ39062.1 hypothetical protein [Bryobacteraceae bacterium]
MKNTPGWCLSTRTNIAGFSGYRKRYAASLKRELPRIPFAPDFDGGQRTGAAAHLVRINRDTFVMAPWKPLSQFSIAITIRAQCCAAANAQAAFSLTIGAGS